MQKAYEGQVPRLFYILSNITGGIAGEVSWELGPRSGIGIKSALKSSSPAMANFYCKITRWLKLFFALAMLWLVTGCSEALKVLIYNSTNREVLIVQGKKSIAVQPGAVALVRYPTSSQGRLMEIIIDRKTHLYIFPNRPDLLPIKITYDAPVYLQLQPDLGIYYVPARLFPPTDAKLVAAAQIGGFPIYSEVQ